MTGAGRRIIKIEEILLILLVLTIGYLGGVTSTYQLSSLNEKTVYNPSYNLTCPEPVRNVQMTSTEADTEKSTNDYIQAAYTDVDYEVDDGEVAIEVSDVSRPEGKSMRPTIFSGNTLLMSDYDGGKISEGEILRYSTDSGYVIHRVQANYLNTGDYLLMKGDNNEHSSRIEKSQITHRVTGVLYTPQQGEAAAFKD